jgi:hypothetical protein
MLLMREAELLRMKDLGPDVLLDIRATLTTSNKKNSKGNSDAEKDKRKHVCTHCISRRSAGPSMYGKPDSKRGKKDKDDDNESKKANANRCAQTGVFDPDTGRLSDSKNWFTKSIRSGSTQNDPISSNVKKKNKWLSECSYCDIQFWIRF